MGSAVWDHCTQGGEGGRERKSLKRKGAEETDDRRRKAETHPEPHKKKCPILQAPGK